MRANLPVLVALLGVLAGTAGCDSGEVGAGPPRCEPEAELQVERLLKRGFRALAEQRFDDAREAFGATLELAPDHPEARQGLRAIETRRPAPAPAVSADGGVILLAGDRIRAGLAVNRERYRYEELHAQRELLRERGELDTRPPRQPAYGPRRGSDGQPLAADDAERLVSRVDLVVLHDTGTLTARGRYVELRDESAAAHFTIDWDGTVYQNLDLVWAARHTGSAAFDARSVAIELVNPVSKSSPPLPPGADAGEYRRPEGQPRRIQGKEHRGWGYTDAQLDSLSALCHALVRVFPRLERRVPRDEQGYVVLRALGEKAAGFTGFLGHLHLSRRALDPGAGFDWEAFEASLH